MCTGTGPVRQTYPFSGRTCCKKGKDCDRRAGQLHFFQTGDAPPLTKCAAWPHAQPTLKVLKQLLARKRGPCVEPLFISQCYSIRFCLSSDGMGPAILIASVFCINPGLVLRKFDAEVGEVLIRLQDGVHQCGPGPLVLSEPV